MFVINFMKYKWVAIGFSVIVIAGTFIYTFVEKKGFSKDLDFAGGIKIEIAGNDKINLESLKQFFEKQQIKATVLKASKGEEAVFKIEIDSKQEVILMKKAQEIEGLLSESQLSPTGADYIKYNLAEQLTDKDLSKVVYIGTNQVGPAVGEYLFKSSIYLLILALALITVYVSFRFKLKFAIGAMLALLHDLLFTVGFIGALQIPLSIPVIAALLTILGYSINDTIVIFDRIRENMAKNDNHAFSRLIDISITESLTRTTITALTTLLSIVGVYMFGGEALEGMALTLIFGISIGTYSSNYIASPILLAGKPIQE